MWYSTLLPLFVAATIAARLGPLDYPRSVRRQDFAEANSTALLGDSIANTTDDLGTDWLDYTSRSAQPGRAGGISPSVVFTNITFGNDSFAISVSKCATRWDVVVGSWQFANGTNADGVTWRQIYSDAFLNRHSSGGYLTALGNAVQTNAQALGITAQKLAAQYLQDFSSSTTDNDAEIVHVELRRLLQGEDMLGLGMAQEVGPGLVGAANANAALQAAVGQLWTWELILTTGVLSAATAACTIGAHYAGVQLLDEWNKGTNKYVPLNATITDSLWAGQIGIAVVIAAVTAGFIHGAVENGALERDVLAIAGVVARFRQLLVSAGFLAGLANAAAASGTNGKFTEQQLGQGLTFLNETTNPSIGLVDYPSAFDALDTQSGQCQ